MKITVEVSGFKEIHQKVENIKQSWRGEKGKVYQDITDIGDLSTQLNFLAHGRPNIWEPRAPLTLKLMARSHRPPWPPLVKTGTMRSEVLRAWEGWKHELPKHILEIRAVVPYAPVHQYGAEIEGVVIPKRTYVILQPEEIQQCRDTIRKPFITQQ